MSLYIYDPTEKKVRHYLTSKNIDNAVHTLLSADPNTICAVTKEGYHLEIKQDEEEEN